MDIVDRAQRDEGAYLAAALSSMRSAPDEEQLVENGRVVCRDCGEPIPAARLAACPGACRCVVCQEAAEASGDR